MVQRSLPFLVLAGLVSCKGDPTGDLRNGTDHLLASPSAIFLNSGASKFVVVTAVDEQGNPVAAKFSDGTAGAGVAVARDLTYLPVYDADGNLVVPPEVTAARYSVTANAATGNSSISVSAGGKTVTVPVRIIPTSTTGIVTASSGTPGNADTTSLTLAAPYKFASTSVATIGGAAVYKVGVSADSSVMRIVAPPGANGTVSVTNVVLGYAPAAGSFTGTSTGTIVTPAIPNVTLNKTNAVAGDTIVVTAPAKFKFTTASAPTVTGAGLASLGISADSSTLRFLIGPNANAVVSVNNLRVAGALTIGPFTATSAAPLVTPSIPNFPATFSAAAPNIQDTITVTAGAGFKFLPTATFATGGVNAFVVSRGADSSSARIVPIPGTTSGPVTVTGVVLSFLRTVSLTLPSNNTLTVPAAYAGATAIATAPTINIPATGATTMYLDNGATVAAAACANVGNHCRFYKIVLAAPRTFRVTLNWGNTADIGGYFIDAAGNDLFGNFACDNFGSGAAGQPEQCSQTLAAGTWYLALADFTAAAQNTNYRITILGQ